MNGLSIGVLAFTVHVFARVDVDVVDLVIRRQQIRRSVILTDLVEHLAKPLDAGERGLYLELKGDANFGVKLMRLVAQRPVRTIAQNGGLDGAVVARKVLAGKGKNFGFNALTGEYGDMFEFGVIDPTKVTRSALQNAVSVASLLLTTDCVITEAKKTDDKEPAGEHGHM